jgi:integrase
MSPEAVSPLRRRMIEDMTIRQFGEHTKRDYIRQVGEFTSFLGRSPDRAEPEDLRRYQLHLASLGASYARMNLASTALRFFFHVTLGRAGFGDRMARIPTPERLPVVLSPEEVALLLAHAPSLKYRAALSVAYGCGLRVSEIANLKVADIDSARMLVRVEQGKDRFVMLAPDLLDLLRQWWRVKGRAVGSSPANSPPSRSPGASSTAPAMPLPRPPGSTSASRCTRCGTASPRISWSARPTSA